MYNYDQFCLFPFSLFDFLQDAESHGGGKNIGASISLLERNVSAPDRGDVCLRYVAATTEDADFMLGKILYKDMLGIRYVTKFSFSGSACRFLKDLIHSK